MPCSSAYASSLQEIMNAAFRRSFRCSLPCWHEELRENSVAFLPLPPASGKDFRPGRKQKILVFGSPVSDAAPALPAQLGLGADASLPSLAGKDACMPCTAANAYTLSQAYFGYAEHELTAALTPELRRRPFTRFDFTDEWNNLGFGRIRTDDSLWAVKGGMRVAGAVELAGIWLDGLSKDPVYAGAYLALLDLPEASVLWCARPVGPVDSVEWSVIERFVCDWRAGDLPCFPCVRQTPFGCKAVVTMRLDCDEDISSARDLFEWYADEGIPFSLAVKTGLPMSDAHMALLRDVLAAGGTLLSHSHTHPYDWGATAEEALAEATASRRWFQVAWPHLAAPVLAVSPFHSNPPYAMQALEQAGFTGVVSGIIHNDPEYLLGRAGIVPFTEGKLVSISQQSMLHGDCYRQQGNRVDVHVQAFEAQYAARGIFGYLDHPFSERYQYGWESRAQRLAAHQRLLASVRSRPDVWFWNQKQCFDFILACSRLLLHMDPDGTVTAEGLSPEMPYRPVYRLRGEEHVL